MILTLLFFPLIKGFLQNISYNNLNLKTKFFYINHQYKKVLYNLIKAFTFKEA
jgi:hypothetical protein